MEFELFNECAEDDYAYGAQDIDNDQLVLEGDESQRCGICMDVVVDRGVLDCCQHWFCFSCIDNWASITNLCPLCQNEFQLITCVPVYDAIGGVQPDDGSYSRDDGDDDEWSVEGNDNTLSSPSYYIDENAVSCLEGDSCKIRGQTANIEEDPDLDTSIACDSCDLWYHAICVGFDADGNCENSWLCPGCLVDETSEKSELGPESCSHEYSTFPMNVSVSVADAGETAVVVSIIDKNQQTMKIENQENEQMILPASDICEKLERQVVERVLKKPKIETEELDFCTNFEEETHVSDGFRSSDLNEDNKSLESDKIGTTEEVEKMKVPKARRLPVDKNPNKKEKSGGTTGAKRKQRDFSADEDETKTKIQNNISPKAVKTDKKTRVANSTNDPKNSNNGNIRKQKVVTDIKDIVQGTYNRPKKRLAPQETSSGLRIKKIIRKTDDKESLVQVQSLRKEIRDAIRNRSSKEVGENIFDPTLLAAFRAALAGQSQTSEPKRPLDLKAKKQLLQKGTVRENLTKKIYQSGGKRKRAWTRDCEIEFWKHRCLKVSKPEKIETLKSVLDLLRKGPEIKEIKKEKEINSEPANSILSRLYVADTSVFPRKDDIMPLSVKPTDSLVDCKEIKTAGSCNNGGPASRKVNPSKSTGGSRVNEQKELVSGLNNVKFDKKKWALEVLARKTAVSGNSSSQGQDNAVLKGNYPLLAKLPVEMRPSLASCSHNKIPISVRQAQLNRLTEHFLKKTNKPVTQPTAEIELAVADAINVEKAVADKSNSKLVYVNLCSQELLHRSDNTDSSTEPNPEPKTAIDNNSLSTNADVDVDVDVDEALRNAGLLSDSPPDSPHQHDEDGPENVFEIDSQPELDIYGDFEYDIEDDDFIGGKVVKTCKVEENDTKIKMVFSTLKPDSDTWCYETPLMVENDDINKEKKDEIVDEIEELYGPDKEPLIEKYPEIKLPDLVIESNVVQVKDEQGLNKDGGEDLTKMPLEKVESKEKKSDVGNKQQSDKQSSVFKKVEAYIKEHIRPLCKSGVITVEQYRWAVGKTTDKIMKYHSKDTNANFLIKEGEKVKKLAEQYVESAPKSRK